MVCFQSILCGEASTNRLPGINPAGYVSHTGYQYDSISRVAGHRELAPPSKFSKLGGFNSNVFITSGIRHPQLLLVEIVPPLNPQTLPPLLCLRAAPNVQYLVYRSGAASCTITLPPLLTRPSLRRAHRRSHHPIRYLSKNRPDTLNPFQMLRLHEHRPKASQRFAVTSHTRVQQMEETDRQLRYGEV